MNEPLRPTALPSQQAIEAQIARILREQLAVTLPLSAETDLLADLQLDSVQQLTLIVELENHFRLCFDPGDEAGLSTLGSVAALLRRRLGEAQEAEGSAQGEDGEDGPVQIEGV